MVGHQTRRWQNGRKEKSSTQQLRTRPVYFSVHLCDDLAGHEADAFRRLRGELLELPGKARHDVGRQILASRLHSCGVNKPWVMKE